MPSHFNFPDPVGAAAAEVLVLLFTVELAIVDGLTEVLALVDVATVDIFEELVVLMLVATEEGEPGRHCLHHISCSV